MQQSGHQPLPNTGKTMPLRVERTPGSSPSDSALDDELLGLGRLHPPASWVGLGRPCSASKNWNKEALLPLPTESQATGTRGQHQGGEPLATSKQCMQAQGGPSEPASRLPACSLEEPHLQVPRTCKQRPPLGVKLLKSGGQRVWLPHGPVPMPWRVCRKAGKSRAWKHESASLGVLLCSKIRGSLKGEEDASKG